MLYNIDLPAVRFKNKIESATIYPFPEYDLKTPKSRGKALNTLHHPYATVIHIDFSKQGVIREMAAHLRNGGVYVKQKISDRKIDYRKSFCVLHTSGQT